MLLEVVHELIDVLADLKAINGSRQAELHAKLTELARSEEPEATDDAAD